MADITNEGLKREVGLLDVVANVLNISIASGIFLLPAILAGLLGNASILAYLLCGTMFKLVALCYAEISSRITDTGGAYVYIEKTFGPFAGFLSNTLFWFGTGVFVAAALLNGLVDMLTVAFPVLSPFYFKVILFIIILTMCTVPNIVGVKQGMRMVKALTFLKVLPLILLVIIGCFFIDPTNFQRPGFSISQNLGPASLILFFAFVGGETALNISGEMKNPNRTAPLGLIIGAGFVVIFFCAIQLVAQGVMGKDLVNHPEAPLAVLAGKIVGRTGFILIIVVSMLSVFSCLSSVLMLFPRIMYAGAKHKHLPQYLSFVHPRFATPTWAIISFSVIAFLVAVSGGFKQLAVLATGTMIVLYIGVVCSVIKLRLQKKSVEPVFRLPGGFTIPVLALIALCWFLLQLKKIELTGIAIFIAVISIIYLVRNRYKKMAAE